MSEITINVDDYLSEDDKRKIVVEAFSTSINMRVGKDFERILSNISYETVSTMVDTVIGADSKEIMKEKAYQIINKLSDHTVFHAPNVWDKEASKGWVYLQEVLSEIKPAIKDQVDSVISKLDADYMREGLNEIIYQVVEDRIIGKKGEAE